MSDSMMKRLSTILLTLIILIGFNATILVSADFDKYNGDGIWIDPFDNSNDFTMDSNLVLNSSNNRIELGQGEPMTRYNHSEYPDNVKAWTQSFGLLGYPLAEELIKLINPNRFPGDPVKGDITKIDKLDDERLETKSPWLSGTTIAFSPMHHFQFKVNQKKENIKNITIKWWFGNYEPDANLKEISLWVWNYGNFIGNWVDRDKVTYNDTNILNQEVNPDLSVNITNSYVSDDGHIDIIIAGTPLENLDPTKVEDQPYLCTDWIEVDVSTTFGYLSEGELTSIPITPPDFGGWENVFWEGSKPSQTTEITIQILDENNSIIKNYEGKTSPIDISSIKNTTIKLKAILHSYSPDATPFLKSWGISWQRKDRYQDSFTHTYRISESNGVTIQGGNIKVNEFYSNWGVFGKDSGNTRSYDGAGLTSSPDDIYWRSKSGVGGGFRQVISGNGKVYVSSVDKKIYSLNSTKNSDPGVQDPADHSKAKYNVDSCIGVSGNYLVIGTCDTNAANKIYALSTTNLSIELWNQSISSNPICFSSPPTIYDDKVFITSWSGKTWDIPMLSIFNKFLDINNKLIALDLSSGESLWDPLDLPAGSLSAPAVGNNMVFVGCQNMWGSSLFAYDIDTGEEVWNASVGVIGRASPVYADGKIFVLSREKDNFTSLGTNKVVSVDAKTGEEIWNISIGEVKFSSLINILRGLNLYQMLLNFAPMTSPAYYDDTLYVLSQNGNLLALNPDNGKTKWSYDLNKDAPYSYYVASPVVVSDQVYVLNGNTKLYAFGTKNEGDSVKPLWTYQVNESQYWPLKKPDLLASPIIADGLMMLSCTEDVQEMVGRIYCIGNYSPNYHGAVISNSIHLPSGYWWNKFNADFDQTNNNTIKFYVLDNGNEINVNGTNGDLSGIKSKVIRLKADFNIKESSEAHPVLKNWSISWSLEDAEPEFSSFKPGQDNWTNDLTPTCSIQVEDKGKSGVVSGLDIESAQFRIDYKKSNQNKTSDWYPANSSDESGVNKTTLYANIGDLDLDIDELENITFMISDLAGNKATYSKTGFKFDFVKPTSEIEGSYLSEYTDAFNITASADDSKSGVYSVELKYRSKKSNNDDWSDWLTYGSPRTTEPYEWKFDTTASAYYQVVSIAKDKADNEELPSANRAIEFKFDMVPPSLDSVELITSPNVIPKVRLTASDDLELGILYYSYNQSKWFKMKDDINENTFTTTWTMDEENWTNMIGGDTKKVYFKVVDSCGNEYNSTDEESPLIVKGENASSYYIDVSDFSQWHWDNKFTISVKFPEEFSVKSVTLYYKYSKNNKDWPENYTVYDNKSGEDSYEWTMAPPKNSGYYKFKAVITDTSGEVYESAASVNVTMFPTTLFLMLITMLIVLVIVAAAIMLKMRKKKPL